MLLLQHRPVRCAFTGTVSAPFASYGANVCVAVCATSVAGAGAGAPACGCAESAQDATVSAASRAMLAAQAPRRVPTSIETPLAGWTLRLAVTM